MIATPFAPAPAPVAPTVRDDWLVTVLREIVPAQALHAALAKHPPALWRAVTEAALATDQQIIAALAKRTRLPIATDFPTSDVLRTIIPEATARRFHVVPIAASPTAIHIATATPYDLACEQYLAFSTHRTVHPHLATPTTIDERLDALYRPRHADVNALLASINSQSNPHVESLDTTDDTPAPSTSLAADDRPVIKLVDAILAAAVSARATDIHLEPTESGAIIRHRVDGVLHHALSLPKWAALPMISRFKVMGRMDIADRVRPQDGHTRIALNGSPIDLRLSTLPASLGEKLVVRILDPHATLRSLDTLGFDPPSVARLKLLLDTREGLILITGPTGSGKTTTLYAALHTLLQRGLNIVTVEDPVEYRVPGIVQVQVNHKAGLTFATALKSILRQDPDVILIGEIRDLETATIAIQASLTGHLVFATLHTIDAASSITRLHDLGVTPSKVAAALKGVIAQRLLRKRCETCATRANDKKEGTDPALAFAPSPNDASRTPPPTPCSACSHTGYKGRIAAGEIVLVTPNIQRHISAATPTSTLTTTIRQSGAHSMWSSALLHVELGATTLDEIHRVLDPDAPPDGTRTIPDGAPPPDYAPPPPPRPPKPPKRSGPTPATPDDDQPQPHEEGTPPFSDTTRHPVPSRPHDSDPDHDGAGYDGKPANLNATTMTQIVAGLIDVYVIDPSRHPWRALLLQRAQGTRSPGSWEAVHGKIEPDETPEQTALREIKEETGLDIQRLYNIMVQPFYLHQSNTVQLAIVFCAFADSSQTVTRSDEHQAHTWLSIGEAVNRYTWPRAIQAIRSIEKLLANNSAGPAEDVMRVV